MARSMILAYDPTEGTWKSGHIDLLAANVILDPICYIFLENGNWYKQCPEMDRYRILELLQVPKFLGRKICTNLNGYFGCRSSVEAGSKGILKGLTAWFRILTKKTLIAEEALEYGGAEYIWYEMGFFIQWSGISSARVLCIDTPQSVRTQLAGILAGSPSLELRDPFAMLYPLLDEVITECDDNTWRVTRGVRDIEKAWQPPNISSDARAPTLLKWRYGGSLTRSQARHEKPTFEVLNNLARHVRHTVEVESVAVETLQRLASQQQINFTRLPGNIPETYQIQAQEYLAFQLQMMKSLRWRAQASSERLDGEIHLAYNILASTDNQIMKSVALLTMIFLPSTFIATLFSTTFFSFAEDGWLASNAFWIYWVVVIPLSIAVVLAWRFWLGRSKSIRSRLLRTSK
ncbi:hypothetical protein F5Y13DRAFT_182368 [Hypoxylon sp. FL1857]|nr:hypothetical protein F5Y13DRAFT_182368 [Hypoxylon sp. FL1857]